MCAMLTEICELLESYKGRDKVLRTLCYSAKLASGISWDSSLANKLGVFSSQMSKTRAVLRLLDDLPMLKYTWEYGLGGNEPDGIMACMGVLTNLIDQVYYPIEKMSWLADNGLIRADGKPWDVASSVCWVASIYLTLMKSLRLYHTLRCRLPAEALDADGLRQLRWQTRNELLTCVRLSLDLVHSINTLPHGWLLWSGRLCTWQVGAVATLSSLLGLYQMLARNRRNK